MPWTQFPLPNDRPCSSLDLSIFGENTARPVKIGPEREGIVSERVEAFSEEGKAAGRVTALEPSETTAERRPAGCESGAHQSIGTTSGSVGTAPGRVGAASASVGTAGWSVATTGWRVDATGRRVAAIGWRVAATGWRDAATGRRVAATGWRVVTTCSAIATTLECHEVALLSPGEPRSRTLNLPRRVRILASADFSPAKNR